MNFDEFKKIYVLYKKMKNFFYFIYFFIINEPV